MSGKCANLLVFANCSRFAVARNIPAMQEALRGPLQLMKSHEISDSHDMFFAIKQTNKQTNKQLEAEGR